MAKSGHFSHKRHSCSHILTLPRVNLVSPRKALTYSLSTASTLVARDIFNFDFQSGQSPKSTYALLEQASGLPLCMAVSEVFVQ